MTRINDLGKRSNIAKTINATNAPLDWQTQIPRKAATTATAPMIRTYHRSKELANPLINKARVIKELPIVFVLIQISESELPGAQMLCPSGTWISVNTRYNVIPRKTVKTSR